MAANKSNGKGIVLNSKEQSLLEKALIGILWGTNSGQPMELSTINSQLEQKLGSEFLRFGSTRSRYSTSQLASYGLSKLEGKQIATHRKLREPDPSGGQTYYWLQR